MVRQQLILLFFLLMSVMSFSQDLKDYRWKNRILLLCEDGEELIQSREQIEKFSSLKRQMEERQLLILVFDGKTLRDKDLNPLMELGKRIREGFEGVLLIGKDGGVKSESEFFVSPAAIFDIIDSMPMRQAEMRRNKRP